MRYFMIFIMSGLFVLAIINVINDQYDRATFDLVLALAIKDRFTKLYGEIF